MTNADKLRSLSDEQIVDLFYDMKHCDWFFSCIECAVYKLGLKGLICGEIDREMIRFAAEQEQEEK